MSAALKLASRVAIVTGAARGIGRAICLALAVEGCHVVVNDLGREQEADDVVRAVTASNSGAQALSCPADVSRTDDVHRLIQAGVDHFGRLDILVNNAALTQIAHKPWSTVSEDDWDRTMAVNLKSCFLTVRAAYPYLKASPSGRIVNISSVTVWLGPVNQMHYVSSKAGMIGLTRSLARELGPDGITVNAVTPGAIRTEGERERFPDDAQQLRILSERQSLRRLGQPEDIGGAVAFLASDDASFITGHALNVDGGWAMY